MVREDQSTYERMTGVVERYWHERGTRKFQPAILLEMIATELAIEKCEWPTCGNAGVRVIVVTGYGGVETEREHVCTPHAGPMIAQKQQGYLDLDLAVPLMRHQSV